MVNKDEYIKYHGSCEKSCVGATGRKLYEIEGAH